MQSRVLFRGKNLHPNMRTRNVCREWFHREMQFAAGLHVKGREAHRGDLIIQGDVDEIPRPEAVQALRSCEWELKDGYDDCAVLEGPFFYFSYSWYAGERTGVLARDLYSLRLEVLLLQALGLPRSRMRACTCSKLHACAGTCPELLRMCRHMEPWTKGIHTRCEGYNGRHGHQQHALPRQLHAVHARRLMALHRLLLHHPRRQEQNLRLLPRVSAPSTSFHVCPDVLWHQCLSRVWCNVSTKYEALCSARPWLVRSTMQEWRGNAPAGSLKTA